MVWIELRMNGGAMHQFVKYFLISLFCLTTPLGNCVHGSDKEEETLIWVGPGWYYGLWFESEPDFYIYQREYDHNHRYQDRYHRQYRDKHQRHNRHNSKRHHKDRRQHDNKHHRGHHHKK